MAVSSQPGQWKQGTFECCSDVPQCLFATCFGPCFDFTTVKAAEESTMCAIITFCFPLALCCVRSNVREKKGIEGSAINDFLCTVCCHCCTSLQLKHECTH